MHLVESVNAILGSLALIALKSMPVLRRQPIHAAEIMLFVSIYHPLLAMALLEEHAAVRTGTKW